MSKKISIYLPDRIAKWLEDWAEEEGRTLSSLAVFLIEKSIRDYRMDIEQMKREVKESEDK